MKNQKHSSTALVIAKSTFSSARHGELSALITEEAARLCAWFLQDHARDYGLLRQAWYARGLRALEAWILPGVQLHYAARKKLIEITVERALAEGTPQVVIVAAGFDTLAYRLHSRWPAVRFFELDHPATQASKRASLGARGNLAQNLCLHSVDLTRTTLHSALAEAGVERHSPSVIVAEGLLMYLPDAQVESFVESVAEYFTAALDFVATFMLPDPRGRRRFHNGSKLLDLWLAVEGEPFMSAYDHEHWRALLARHGFPQADLWDQERIRQEVLPAPLRSLPLAIGEHVSIARRAAPASSQSQRSAGRR